MRKYDHVDKEEGLVWEWGPYFGRYSELLRLPRDATSPMGYIMLLDHTNGGGAVPPLGYIMHNYADYEALRATDVNP